MPTTESRADLDIQVRAHVLANAALYEQAGRDIDKTYSPEAFWQDDLAFYKAQPSYPVDDYQTLDQWRSAAKRTPLIVSRMLEHHRYDRGIPPADEAARVVLLHWVLTDQACNSAPVKLTAFQDWSIASVNHELMRAYAYDTADNTGWREYVRKALAVMQSQSAMAGTKPVPILGVIWHDARAPATALKDAFDRYWQTIDAATVPAGDDRRIPEDAGAVLLSEVTEGLHNAIAAEHGRLLIAHGREIDPPNNIQLWETDYLDGRDATLIPKRAVKSRVVEIGRDGADARLMTAIERVWKATACPVERHNAQNAIKPGGPHRRYCAGDVIRRDTLDALESVGKLLRLSDHPLTETVARIEAATSALPAIMESHTRGMERVAAAIEAVQPRSDDRIVETKPAQPIRTAIADDAWMTHMDIADHHRIKREAFRKRLDRYRASNHNGWKEVDQRATNEPKYLFRYGDVKGIALDLQASAAASGERPAK